jgi:DNA-binding IclR family transcriptional regulator
VILVVRDHAADSFDALMSRVRGEYGEMPGLRLTVSQACRLWHVDASTCERLFEQLVREGFLYRTEKSAYIARPAD